MEDIIKILDGLKQKLEAIIFEIDQIKKQKLKKETYTIEIKDKDGRVVKTTDF